MVAHVQFPRRRRKFLLLADRFAHVCLDRRKRILAVYHTIRDGQGLKSGDRSLAYGGSFVLNSPVGSNAPL